CSNGSTDPHVWGAHAPPRAGDGASPSRTSCHVEWICCDEASQPTREARVLPRKDHASARFGSISSVTLDSKPLCNRNDAAKAIMAALSVHSHDSAVLNSKPPCLHAAPNCFRNC